MMTAGTVFPLTYLMILARKNNRQSVLEQSGRKRQCGCNAHDCYRRMKVLPIARDRFLVTPASSASLPQADTPAFTSSMIVAALLELISECFATFKMCSRVGERPSTALHRRHPRTRWRFRSCIGRETLASAIHDTAGVR